MFFFRSERQPNNIGQAYFYLLGVAIYSYSSFQLGRFEWTNFVSWGRNIVLEKKALNHRPAGTKFLTKNKFSFQIMTSLAKFRRHIKCTEIFVAFQLAFESRRISCRRFSQSQHTHRYAHIHFTRFIRIVEQTWHTHRYLGYLGQSCPIMKTLSLQGNYVIEN